MSGVWLQGQGRLLSSWPWDRCTCTQASAGGGSEGQEDCARGCRCSALSVCHGFGTGGSLFLQVHTGDLSLDEFCGYVCVCVEGWGGGDLSESLNWFCHGGWGVCVGLCVCALKGKKIVYVTFCDLLCLCVTNSRQVGHYLLDRDR